MPTLPSQRSLSQRDVRRHDGPSGFMSVSATVSHGGGGSTEISSDPFPQTHSPLSLRMGSNPRTDVLRPHAITAALIARVSPDALQKTLFVRSC